MVRASLPLQRLSRALAGGKRRLRSTDWWTVIIEVAVVVLGILIALQLQEWNDARHRRADEKSLLQRIEEEAAADFRSVHRIWQQHRESADNYRLLARAVRNPAAHADFDRRGARGCNLLRMPAVRRSSGGLGAAERMELISDERLRLLLRRAAAERVFADNQLPVFREAFQRYSPIIEPHMRWTFQAAGIACSVDIDSLRNDPGAIALLPKLSRDQRQFARYRASEGIATYEVLQRVRCLRQSNCTAD